MQVISAYNNAINTFFEEILDQIPICENSQKEIVYSHPDVKGLQFIVRNEHSYCLMISDRVEISAKLLEAVDNISHFIVTSNCLNFMSIIVDVDHPSSFSYDYEVLCPSWYAAESTRNRILFVIYHPGHAG